MKKTLLLLFVSLLVSCSDLNNKLENAITKEIGKSPTQNELVSDTKVQIILWENVSTSKRGLIKNLVDKEFGSLPLEISELNQQFDNENNPIEGNFYQYQVYENTTAKVELSFRYYNNKADLMNIRLYITTK